MLMSIHSGRGPSGINTGTAATSSSSSVSSTPTATAVATPKKTRGGGEEEEDLTQGMEDPPAEPRIVEVVANPTNPPISGQSGAASAPGSITATGNKKQDSELQPLKSGNMADLDEPVEGTKA